MIEPREAEKLVYEWCTCESRGTTSARALATVYASSYLDHVPLLRFMESAHTGRYPAGVGPGIDPRLCGRATARSLATGRGAGGAL